MEPETTTPPTSDERTFAMLAHLLQLFGGFIGPLVIFFVKRDSRFVAFHAIQALVWQVAYFILAMIGVVAWLVLIFSTVAMHSNSGHSSGPPVAILIFLPLIWLFFAGGWIVTLILSVVYGIKANQGQWALYPIVGQWAQRFIRS